MKHRDDGLIGNCPHCDFTDGYRNIGRMHWGICHAHRMKWRVGENLFSSWRYEDELIHLCNAALLSEYQEVDL